MKKLLIGVLVMAVVFSCSALGEDLIAEILPSDTEVYYGETKLEVSTYSDETTVYVPLETLILALGGTYELQEGKAVIALDPELLPALCPADVIPSGEVEPALSWEYINYYCMENYGETAKQLFEGWDAAEVVNKIEAAISKNVDLDKLISAIDSAITSAGFATQALDALIK